MGRKKNYRTKRILYFGCTNIIFANYMTIDLTIIAVG